MKKMLGNIEIKLFNDKIVKEVCLPDLKEDLYFIYFIFESSNFYESEVIRQIIDKIKTLSAINSSILIPKSIKNELKNLGFIAYMDTFLENSEKNYIAKSYDFVYDLCLQYGEFKLISTIPHPKRIYNCDDNRDFWFDDTAIRLTNGNLNKSLIITKEKAFYIDGWDKHVKLNEVNFPKLLLFLENWQFFLLTYESCQIPGLIPESKLNTWSCVPNEYIKPEYWELLKKQQQEQKDNEI